MLRNSKIGGRTEQVTHPTKFVLPALEGPALVEKAGVKIHGTSGHSTWCERPKERGTGLNYKLSHSRFGNERLIQNEFQPNSRATTGKSHATTSSTKDFLNSSCFYTIVTSYNTIVYKNCSFSKGIFPICFECFSNIVVYHVVVQGPGSVVGTCAVCSWFTSWRELTGRSAITRSGSVYQSQLLSKPKGCPHKTEFFHDWILEGALLLGKPFSSLRLGGHQVDSNSNCNTNCNNCDDSSEDGFGSHGSG